MLSQTEMRNKISKLGKLKLIRNNEFKKLSELQTRFVKINEDIKVLKEEQKELIPKIENQKIAVDHLHDQMIELI